MNMRLLLMELNWGMEQSLSVSANTFYPMEIHRLDLELFFCIDRLGAPPSYPGNGGVGSLVSDLTDIIESGGVGIHKDDICLIAEGIFETYNYLFHVEFQLETLVKICSLATSVMGTFDSVGKAIYFRDSKIKQFNLLEVLIPNGTHMKSHLDKLIQGHQCSEYLPKLSKKGILSTALNGVPITPCKNRFSGKTRYNDQRGYWFGLEKRLSTQGGPKSLREV
ncbi:hypothetical protein BJ741DRAFT_578083 [Chytriomyces cf. hyalinus JEL632]|nr:hypothetical protein BJ741DRAFT_578083 [Chytriomyces cf. hyalinus JEL632]